MSLLVKYFKRHYKYYLTIRKIRGTGCIYDGQISTLFADESLTGGSSFLLLTGSEEYFCLSCGF